MNSLQSGEGLIELTPPLLLCRPVSNIDLGCIIESRHVMIGDKAIYHVSLTLNLKLKRLKAPPAGQSQGVGVIKRKTYGIPAILGIIVPQLMSLASQK